MTTNTTGGASPLRPEDVQQLVIQPLIQLAVATQVSNVVQTASTSTRFPIVVTDPVTGWTPEGEEITPSDADLNEVDVIPKKLAVLTIITNELANDSGPSALQVVGDGLVRDLQLKLDAAYFVITTVNGPDGIGSVSNVQLVDAGSSVADLDWAAEALSKAETVGSTLTAFVAHPTTVLSIMQLKTGTDFIQPLLGRD